MARFRCHHQRSKIQRKKLFVTLALEKPRTLTIKVEVFSPYLENLHTAYERDVTLRMAATKAILMLSEVT